MVIILKEIIDLDRRNWFWPQEGINIYVMCLRPGEFFTIESRTLQRVTHYL